MVKQHGKSCAMAMVAKAAIERGENVYLVQLDGPPLKIVGVDFGKADVMTVRHMIEQGAEVIPEIRKGTRHVVKTGDRKADIFYAEAGPNAGRFRGIVLRCRGFVGGMPAWDIEWRSPSWYASAQQARGVALRELRRA